MASELKIDQEVLMVRREKGLIGKRILPALAFAAVFGSAGATAQAVYLNCGSPNNYVAANGITWLADKGFTGGQNVYSSDTIQGTNEQWLFRTAREGLYTDFKYSIPVPNGTYSVQLSFAEIVKSSKGQRIFHVLINGSTVLPNFDILANVAPRTVLTRTFFANVTGGAVNIETVGVVGRGLINNIQIVPTSSPGAVLVSVSPAKATVSPGGKIQFLAQVTGTTDRTVTWSVTGIGSIDSNGVYLAPASVASIQDVTITARSKVSGTAQGTAIVTVRPSISVQVTPATATLRAGQGQQFTAAVTGSSDTLVSWTLSPAVGTISRTGYYTAPATIAATQSIQVKATSAADRISAGTATITLAVPATISVSLDPATATLTSGQSKQFTATVTGTSDPRVTWKTTAGTVSSTGYFTAPTVTATSNATVTATSVVDPTRVATAQVRIDPANSTGPKVYQESGGQVVIEAEHGTIVNRAASWVFRSNVPGFSGTGFLTAEPNTNANQYAGYVGVSPEVQFDVNFTKPGTYTVWVRGYGYDDEDDSVHVGLDGIGVTTGQAISGYPLGPSNWAWSSKLMDYASPASVTVTTAGVHTVNVWMREDGFRFDKIVLTGPGVAAPAGTGPAESAFTGGSPILQVANANLSFAATAGGANPAAQAISITNGGAGALSWTAASNQAWLSVTPSTGVTPAAPNVGVNLSGLAVGTYSGQVTVTAPGVSGSPATVNVQLTVTQVAQVPPTLSVSPSSLSFTTTAGGSNPTPGTVNISNTGGGTLNWTATRTQPWVTLSSPSGLAPSTLIIGAVVAGLSAGTYTDTVTVSSAGASGSPKQIAVTLTVSSTVPPTGGLQFYVAPNGASTGDGSQSRPWDLATALAHPAAVRPGATIWVRGGRYGTGHTLWRSRLIGTAAAPIIVRNYPGERASIDGWLQVGCCDRNPQPAMGAHVWFWGLEFASSITDRTGSPSGPPDYGASNIWNAIDSWAPGARFINLVIHDTRQGISWWTESQEGEAYGNLIYNNGFSAPDRGHGHGFYVQNYTGRKVMNDNIVFNQFGWGFNLYGSGDAAYVRNMDLAGNVAFNNGYLSGSLNDNFLVAGGIGSSQSITLRNNHFYNTPSLNDGRNEFGFPWSNLNTDIVADSNYFIGGKSALDVWNWQSVTFTNNVLYSDRLYLVELIPGGGNPSTYNWDRNTYYGSGMFLYGSTGLNWSNWSQTTGVDRNSRFTPGRPTGVLSFVRPNKYEPNRANIVIYNWDLRPSVAVDLTGAIAPGTSYEVRDAQNFFGAPVVSGVYSGGSINIPMTGLVAAPANGTVIRQPVHTGPQFGVFVILPR